jgi:hypothetical protein
MSRTVDQQWQEVNFICDKITTLPLMCNYFNNIFQLHPDIGRTMGRKTAGSKAKLHDNT